MIFIGGINIGNHPRGGQEGKNQVLLRYLDANYTDLITIDSFNWKIRLFLILGKIIKYCAFAKGEKIMISLSNESALYIIKLFNFLKVTTRNEVHYLVVGGEFHQWLSKSNVVHYQKLKGVYPESIKMCNTLKNKGLNNVEQLPNFREIIPVAKKKTVNNPVKFIFLSRIVEEKGCQLIFEAAKVLKTAEFNFSIDFYGPIDDNYLKKFNAELTNNTQIAYKGYLNLSINQGYQQLAEYDIMLFPTFYHGEGYPGVIIDSLIAEVPVIASDWHFNAELIENELNGLIIKAQSIDALVSAMKKCLENSEQILKYSIGAAQSKNNFDVIRIMNKILN